MNFKSAMHLTMTQQRHLFRGPRSKFCDDSRGCRGSKCTRKRKVISQAKTFSVRLFRNAYLPYGDTELPY